MEHKIYHIGLIITDGVIHDMEQTIELIVELSHYPISLVIVGLGDEDFEKMDFLDSDDKVLKSANGSFARRDIVQFVKYNRFRSSEISYLGEAVLEEMPGQFVGYML